MPPSPLVLAGWTAFWSNRSNKPRPFPHLLGSFEQQNFPPHLSHIIIPFQICGLCFHQASNTLQTKLFYLPRAHNLESSKKHEARKHESLACPGVLRTFFVIFTNLRVKFKSFELLCLLYMPKALKHNRPLELTRPRTIETQSLKTRRRKTRIPR